MYIYMRENGGERKRREMIYTSNEHIYNVSYIYIYARAQCRRLAKCKNVVKSCQTRLKNNRKPRTPSVIQCFCWRILGGFNHSTITQARTTTSTSICCRYSRGSRGAPNAYRVGVLTISSQLSL
jgi:hypothetical protein